MDYNTSLTNIHMHGIQLIQAQLTLSIYYHLLYELNLMHDIKFIPSNSNHV